MATLSETPAVVLQPLREYKKIWDERLGAKNDVILNFVFDRYTSVDYVVDQVRPEIDLFQKEFKEQFGATLTHDTAFINTFRKNLEEWINKTNFNGGRFKARVRVILSVDMSRYSFTGVTYKLAIFSDHALVPTEAEVRHNAG